MKQGKAEWRSLSSSFWCGGAASLSPLGDAASAVPSFFVGVLLSPLGWCCLFLLPFGCCCVHHSSFCVVLLSLSPHLGSAVLGDAAHPYQVWCCFLLLGGAAFSHSFWVLLGYPLLLFGGAFSTSLLLVVLLPPHPWGGGASFPSYVMLPSPPSFVVVASPPPFGWWCRYFVCKKMKNIESNEVKS